MKQQEQDLSIAEIQQTVDRWISGTGAGYFSPLTNTAILAEECGEIASIMARRYGDQRAKQSDAVSDTALADEMADLIAAQRAYQLCARVVQTSDEIEQTVSGLRR